jgi:hypothetical protein
MLDVNEIMCEGVDRTDLFQEIFFSRTVMNVIVKLGFA